MLLIVNLRSKEKIYLMYQTQTDRQRLMEKADSLITPQQHTIYCLYVKQAERGYQRRLAVSATSEDNQQPSTLTNRPLLPFHLRC